MRFTVLLCVEMLQMTTVHLSLSPGLSQRSVMTLGLAGWLRQCVAETGEMWRKLGSGSETVTQIGTLAGPRVLGGGRTVNSSPTTFRART